MFKKILTSPVLALLLLASPALADETIAPGWLKYDAARKTVELRVIAAYNGNNGSWNFNGYYEGGSTVVVPLGWTVKLTFENQDGKSAHSLLVTEPFEDDVMPRQAGRDYVAISRAYTRSPEKGCLSCKERLRFKAKKEGRFYLFCGVLGHGTAGMWVYFVVSADADAPYVTVAGDALSASDQPAMP